MFIEHFLACQNTPQDTEIRGKHAQINILMLLTVLEGNVHLETQ